MIKIDTVYGTVVIYPFMDNERDKICSESIEVKRNGSLFWRGKSYTVEEAVTMLEQLVEGFKEAFASIKPLADSIDLDT